MIEQEQRTSEEARIARERLLSEISMISVDDVSEPVPSKSSTSSSTWAVLDLNDDAIGSKGGRDVG